MCNLLVSLKSSDISLAEQFQPVTGLLPPFTASGASRLETERARQVQLPEAARWQPYWVSSAFRSLLWHRGVFQASPFACVEADRPCEFVLPKPTVPCGQMLAGSTRRQVHADARICYPCSGATTITSSQKRLGSPDLEKGPLFSLYAF